MSLDVPRRGRGTSRMAGGNNRPAGATIVAGAKSLIGCGHGGTARTICPSSDEPTPRHNPNARNIPRK